MVEAFYFYDISKGADSEPEISILNKCHDWPVPSEGQFLQVRKVVSEENCDQYMSGRVAMVQLYYCLQNRGPVAKVYLKTSNYLVLKEVAINIEQEMIAEFRQMALSGHKNHADVGARYLVKDFSTCRMTFCQRRYKMCKYSEAEVI